MNETFCECCECQYLGDKYSFEQPNDLIDMDEKNPWIKHYYCNCGDSTHYRQDITGVKIERCKSFEKL